VAAVVVNLLAVAVTVYLLPRLGQVPDDVPFRFQVTYLNLIFALYAAVLSLILVWRAAQRDGARELALALALMALSLSLSPIPAGEPTVAHMVIFASVWAIQVLAVLYFWGHFPQTLRKEEVKGLLYEWGSGMWYDPLNRWVSSMVLWFLLHPAGQILLVLAAAGFGAGLALGHQGYTFLGASVETDPVILALTSPVGLLIILAIAGTAWTSYRLADEQGRRQVLWMFAAHLLTAFMTVMTVSLIVLAGVTGSPVLEAARDGILVAFQPVGWTVTLTAYGVALFYAGAFDLRPVIGRSTVYGGAVIVLTLLFAVIEELVEAQLATRMDLPEGFGTWLGAGSIALLLGPVRARLEDLLDRFMPELNPDEPEADSA